MIDFAKLKELVLFGSSFYVGTAISAVFLLFIAPMLGAENYGKISYFIAIGNIAYAVSFLGSGNALLVYIPKGIRILSSISFITIILGIVASITLFFIFHDIGLCLLVLGLGISDLALNELNARKMYTSFTKYVIIQKLLFVMLGILFYYMIGPMGIVLGYALSFFLPIIRIYKGFKESPINLSLVKSNIGFVMNNYATLLSRTLYGYSDRLVILPLFGFSILGNYELSIQYLSILYIFPVIIYRYVLPHDAVGGNTKNLKVLAIFVSVVFTILTIFLIPVILPLYFHQFTEAVGLIQIMAFAVIPHTLSLMYIARFLGNEKSKIVMMGSVLHLSIQIIGIIILGHLYGKNGVAISLVLAEVIEAIFLMAMNRLVFKKTH